MMPICTGIGASDTHALILNDGRPNPHPAAGSPYGLISPDELLALIADPPSVPKEQGAWIIPSSYNAHDARSHAAQRAHGSYCWLAVDIDRGSPSLEQVSAALAAALGPEVWLAIYSSRSAKPDELKWRALIGLAEPLSGDEYGPYQAALFDALEHQGLQIDRTLERAGQLVYLPNRGELYDWRIQGSALLDARRHPMAARARQYAEVQAALTSGGQARQEGARSHLAAFRRKHSIAAMLEAYGYSRKPGTDHWRSPLSQSGSYSTQDRGDHWISLSHNDAAAGLGKATPNGSRYGDAFDIYAHYGCGGNYAKAEEYARQCLAEADDNRYGDATAEHGLELWSNLQVIGNKLGPAGHRLEMEQAAQRALNIHTPDPEILDKEHDWDIPWPPGVAGEIAKHIYSSSSRPVKQFAIAMSLYIMAGMAGQRYNVEGFGLNLYMAIVGNSGTGKGEARRGAKRIYGAIGHSAQDPSGLANVYDHDFPASASGLRKMFDALNGTRAIYREDADALMESLTNTQPGSNGDLLRAALSTFYDQSGAGLNLGAVRYSKEEDSTGMVSSPSLTLGLDLQVEPFQRYLGHGVVLSTGIGARFLYIVRYGKRMHSRKDRNHDDLDPQVLEHLKIIWNGIRTQINTTTKVAWEPAAHKAFEDMDDAMTDRINKGKAEEDLLNRAHMNAARVAACLAVGINQISPLITEELFGWAKAFVMRGYDECLRMMASGSTGSGERVRVARGLQAISQYIKMEPGRRASTYKVPRGLSELSEVFCEKYFIEKLARLPDFKGSDLGLTSEDLVRRTVAELVRQEYLVETDRAAVADRYGLLLHGRVKQALYLLGPAFGDAPDI